MVRAGNGAQLLFPLALDPRRFGGVAKKGLLVGGDVVADGSERDAHKKNGCNCGGAIHLSPRTKGVFCLKERRIGNEGMQVNHNNGSLLQRMVLDMRM